MAQEQTKLVEVEVKKATHVEAGYYDVMLADVSRIDSKFEDKDGVKKKQLKFIFTLQQNGVALSLFYFTPPYATKQNKLGRLLQAFGIDIGKNEGKKMNVDSLIGKSVRANVVKNEQNYLRLQNFA